MHRESHPCITALICAVGLEEDTQSRGRKAKRETMSLEDIDELEMTTASLFKH